MTIREFLSQYTLIPDTAFDTDDYICFKSDFQNMLREYMSYSHGDLELRNMYNSSTFVNSPCSFSRSDIFFFRSPNSVEYSLNVFWATSNDLLK